MGNDGASPDSSFDELVSMPGDAMVGSPDGCERAIFSGPRRSIGGVLVKLSRLSRCTTRVLCVFSAEKPPLLSGIPNKIKDAASDPNPEYDGGCLSYVV